MLHEGEFRIDDGLVAELIASQMPQWAHLQLRRLHTAGTVNVLYRLGDDMLVRLPRLAAFGEGPLHGSRWLRRFAPAVPLQIPRHLALGDPTPDYPSPWSITDWIAGENATPATLSDLSRTAEQLAQFVLALRSVSPEGGPSDNSRGKGLSRMDPDVRRFVTSLPDDTSLPDVLAVWEFCLSAAHDHEANTRAERRRSLQLR